MAGPVFDIVVVGAGIAGASLGARLAGRASVLLLEMEAQPGYHATGRAVAFWSASYGGPEITPLTLASHAALERPDPAFSERGFLTPRGGFHIGRATDAARCAALADAYGAQSPFAPVDGAELHARIPGLRADWSLGLAEPGIADIDAAGLLGACLMRFRRQGGALRTGARFAGATWRDGLWQVRLSTGETVRAGRLVDAAGAWADEVARESGVAPLGIRPLLRTVVQLRVDRPLPPDMPLVLDLSERFYFKPVGARQIWLTPHDEQPSPPVDAAPAELDVAIAIDRLQQAVDWRVEAVERKWAGLRSFAPDRRPVYGADPDRPAFFWFAGQGGFGLQTAPAAACLGAALLLGEAADPMVAGIDPQRYRPDRLR